MMDRIFNAEENSNEEDKQEKFKINTINKDLKKIQDYNKNMKQTPVGKVYIPESIPISGLKIKTDLPPIDSVKRLKNNNSNKVGHFLAHFYARYIFTSLLLISLI